MSKLPRDIKPKKVIKALERAGFEIDHATGSHYIMKKGLIRTTVPFHKTIKTGTLGAIMKQAGLTIDEFLDLL